MILSELNPKSKRANDTRQRAMHAAAAAASAAAAQATAVSQGGFISKHSIQEHQTPAILSKRKTAGSRLAMADVSGRPLTVMELAETAELAAAEAINASLAAQAAAMELSAASAAELDAEEEVHLAMITQQDALEKEYAVSKYFASSFFALSPREWFSMRAH